MAAEAYIFYANEKEGRKKELMNRWMSEWVLCVRRSDSGQVGSLASQSIWPQFRCEGLLESGVTKDWIFFHLTHTLTHTLTIAEKLPVGVDSESSQQSIEIRLHESSDTALWKHCGDLGTLSVNHRLTEGLAWNEVSC